MYNKLKSRLQPKAKDEPELTHSWPAAIEEKPTIDICDISVVAFHLNLQKEENVYFATFIFEIDCKLKVWALM